MKEELFLLTDNVYAYHRIDVLLEVFCNSNFPSAVTTGHSASLVNVGRGKEGRGGEEKNLFHLAKDG